ncbi:MAG: 30S ribosomal protein S21 [Patescibacteria group bacterium]
MINAEVQKSGSESTLSVIRKFSRKVQGTGLIQTVRKGRYYARNTSKAVDKKRALKRIIRYDNRQELIKEGKLVEEVKKGRRPYQQNNQSSAQATAQQNAAATPTARSSGLGDSTPIAR